MYEKGIVNNPTGYNIGYDVRDLEQRGRVFPSDIDLGFDLDQRFHIILEAKVKGANIQNGQRKYYESLMTMCGKCSIADPSYLGVCITFEYENEYDKNGLKIPPVVSSKLVYQFYDSVRLRWITPPKATPITVGEMIKKYKKIYFKRLGKTEAQYLEDFLETKDPGRKRRIEVYKKSKNINN